MSCEAESTFRHRFSVKMHKKYPPAAGKHIKTHDNQQNK